MAHSTELLAALEQKIDLRTARIAILGLGYVGLPTSLVFAHAGFNVTGVEINPQLIEQLNAGTVKIPEPGLQEYLEEAMAAGRFRATAEVPEADVFVITVPTPLTAECRANLDYVRAAARSLAPRLRRENMVILESTVPPGTCERVIGPLIEELTGLRHGEDYDLLHCPERVAPGDALAEIMRNDRVIGGTTPAAAERGSRLYRTFVQGELLLTTATTAELVKLMENTFRDVNIALANEFGLVCEQVGVEIQEAIRLANRHPRVNIHQPGIGVGGHCIPVVPWFIAETAPELTPLIQMARQVNDRMPAVTADRIEAQMAAAGVKRPGASIGILGLTYKPNVNDFRGAPALAVAHLLRQRGYAVRVWDPFLPGATVELGDLQALPEDEVRKSDFVVELVHHKR
ncbi:MAG: nucleotide sugar dehydrogenase [Armatimonadota bacterium]